MKRLMSKILTVFVLAAFVGPVCGEEKWSFTDWLKNLDTKVQRTEKKRKSRLTSVAAVRGAEKYAVDSKELYWKGVVESKPVTQEEIDDFKSALELAQEGERLEAEKSFLGFLEKYPKSTMAADAEKTLAFLKEEESGEKAIKPAKDAPEEAEKAPGEEAEEKKEKSPENKEDQKKED